MRDLEAESASLNLILTHLGSQQPFVILLPIHFKCIYMYIVPNKKEKDYKK